VVLLALCRLQAGQAITRFSKSERPRLHCMHEAILASPVGAGSNCRRQFPRHAHRGRLPSICKASPRTSDICSLNSTNPSNSSVSRSFNRPSLLRSISSYRRLSALAGKCRFPTDSIHSTGAAIVELTPGTLRDHWAAVNLREFSSSNSFNSRPRAPAPKKPILNTKELSERRENRPAFPSSSVASVCSCSSPA